MHDRGLTSASTPMSAFLGDGSVFEGKLSFEGPLRIDGTFTGEITTTDLLVVGEKAKVSAQINCGSVEINGEVTGNIRATNSIHLGESARVQADIATRSFAIEKGAIFEGNSKMGDGALSSMSFDRRHERGGGQNGRKNKSGRGVESLARVSGGRGSYVPAEVQREDNLEQQPD